MRVSTLIAIGLAAVVAASGASSASAARHARGVRYAFLAQLTGAPGGGRIPVAVQRGNPPALRAMLGHSVAQSFSYNNGTEFLRWSHGKPTVISAGALRPGDFVWIYVRAAAGAPLAAIEQQPAGSVGDYGPQLNPPNHPLFLFHGTLIGASSNSVTLSVHGGNARATHLLIGRTSSQRFAVSASTTVLMWQGKVPTVISLGQLRVGDTINVRIRAPRRASLAQVEATPANRVADLKPPAPPPPPPGIQYAFLGQVTTAPSGGGIRVAVQRGNPPALRAMLGHSVFQTFRYSNGTEFLRWSHGKPTVVSAGNVLAGDFVWIYVRDPVGAPLASIEQQPAGRIADYGPQLNPPHKPLYEFRGTLTGVTSTSVTLSVHGGNARAMHLLINRPSSQRFAVGANTVFLLWEGRVPVVISAGQLKIGDPIIVRIRAPRGSNLFRVESTAANRVGDHEPA